MTIYVDADACPVVVKDILIRAANRTETDKIYLLADESLLGKPSI